MKPLLIATLIIAIVVILGVTLRSAPPAREPAPFAQVPVAPGAGQAPADARFARLLGEWRRSDGDYLLHVRRVGTNGVAGVGYFNPAPIHVAVATAASVDGLLKLYVELQDRGYPGSKYQLSLKAGDETLKGTYFQAATKESFDVAFTRVAGPAAAGQAPEPVTAPAAPPPGR